MYLDFSAHVNKQKLICCHKFALRAHSLTAALVALRMNFAGICFNYLEVDVVDDANYLNGQVRNADWRLIIIIAMS